MGAFTAMLLLTNALLPDAPPHPDDWPAFGYDAANSKFSSLKHINEANVAQSGALRLFGLRFYVDQNGFPAIKPPYGTMNVIDLDKGKILWQVPLGENPELAKRGIEGMGSFSRRGGIATAGGLLFIGATGDNKFRAFAQKDGRVLWETPLPGRGGGIPATYAVDGKQYVTVGVNPSPANGYRGGYVTFGL